jgi:apolipoprotein N-acyltransferase
MKDSARKGWFRFLANAGSLIAGAALFAGAFPNPFFENGLPFLAWIAYVPVFFLISRVSIGGAVLWGAAYGYSAYALFNYWLSVFHPLAGLIVGCIYLVYFAFFFPLLKLAVVLFPRQGYVLQWLLWIGFEYLRTLGFLGYPYGVTGYSQWNMLPIIQIADIFGVWGVSALVVFPSAFIAAQISLRANPNREKKRDVIARRSPFFIWCIALIASLVYGVFAKIDYASAKTARIALIQHNTDPWRGGISEYWNNFETLKRLSNEALRESPKPDLVVWSETAFVPRIYWHQTYRDDQDSWVLVKELLEYLKQQDTPFVIGNDDGRREPDKNPDPSEKHRVDYNAVLLFDKDTIVQSYRKLHLVPFTEHFPYKKQLPFIYEALKNADTHFWEKGNELTIFEINGLRFSTPICFEDTFGYLSRDFALNGAELIVNLSNDAWSKSLPAQTQHLSMAVFRAVENRRAVVRSTASGQTCAVDPNGKILAMARPFTESQITVSVPLLNNASFYTKYGDYLPYFFIAAALLFLLIGAVLRLTEKSLRFNP